MGAHLNGFTASTITNNLWFSPWEKTRSLCNVTSKSLADNSSSIVVRAHTYYAHPQHIRLGLWYNLYVFKIDVGAHLNGSTASTIAHDVVCPLGENKRSLGVTTTGKICLREQWYHGKYSYICTSTSCEGCDRPKICSTLMWEPMWMVGVFSLNYHTTTWFPPR